MANNMPLRCVPSELLSCSEHTCCNTFVFRGAKFSVFQGGVRTAALVHSPLLPSGLAGTATDKLFYVTDWYVST